MFLDNALSYTALERVTELMTTVENKLSYKRLLS